MNCYLHPDAAAVAYCRACGRPLCASCQRPADGTVFCHEHLPAAWNPANPPTNDPNAAANPYFQPVPPASIVDPASTSPALAFLLGWIPGVGAIYNGQYMKGLVHAILFGFLLTLISNTEGTGSGPLFGIILTAFVFYMPFEAFHTAKRRRMGVPVDEWSSIMAHSRYSTRTPIGPVVLILLGVLFLLDTLRIIQFRELARYWPILLIVVGAFMLYNRIAGPPASTTSIPPPGPTNQGFTHDDVMEPRHEQ
jgi:TM2 domain-containing membrane protein YozV